MSYTNRESKKDNENFCYSYAPLKRVDQYSCQAECLCVIPDQRTEFDRMLQAKFGHPGRVDSYGVHTENYVTDLRKK